MDVAVGPGGSQYIYSNSPTSKDATLLCIVTYIFLQKFLKLVMH